MKIVKPFEETVAWFREQMAEKHPSKKALEAAMDMKTKSDKYLAIYITTLQEYDDEYAIWNAVRCAEGETEEEILLKAAEYYHDPMINL